MRRDVCYYFAAPVQAVYNAYLAAATNQQFRRNCEQKPFHTISFGLNFSMKYNMNGGACTLHFIPYQNGTAVDLRFSIAQLAGARYGRYAEDLTRAAEAVLRVSAQLLKLNIDEFLAANNQVTANALPQQPAPAPLPPQPAPVAPQPQSAPAPVPQAAPQNAPSLPDKSCPRCGNILDHSALFCSQCGTPVPKEETGYCSQCGTFMGTDARFCSRCGAKMQ